MVLIIGGSYQGKLDFARQRYGLSPEDIQLCDDRTEAIDPGKRCIAGLERFALNRVRSGCDPMEAFAGMERFRESILICADISGGVVPMDPVLRAWREACGRMCAALARDADEVWRLFCGIPQRLK